MPWYQQSGAFQRRAAVNHQLRWPFARGDGELPLLKAGKSDDPRPETAGIWRMSVETDDERAVVMRREPSCETREAHLFRDVGARGSEDRNPLI